MEYRAEITWYEKGGDTTFEGIFATLQEAVDYIEHWALGRNMCQAWINNKKLPMRNGIVVDAAGNPFCANPAWHAIFADPSEQVLPAFRPQPTRGTAPQNPATQLAKEE